MRILITGPESTGKTSLAHQLSNHYNIPVFSEHARTYLDNHGLEYDFSDLQKIAQQTIDLYQTLPSEQPQIIDTFLFNIKIWAAFKYDKTIDVVEDHISSFQFDHIFLLYPDLPWKYDPMRENPNNNVLLYDYFSSLLTSHHCPFTVIRGLFDARFYQAKDIIDSLML